MCVVPKSIPRPPSTICYKNIIKKLDFWRNAEHIFASLYEHAKAAFWLDSAKEIPGRGEFSFMGDMKGPLG